jgi:holliday junction DNA helicase RuvA
VIASLSGLIAEKGNTEVVIDVNGVGYRVALSLLSLASLPEVGQRCTLRVRTVVREDAFDLYGFLGRDEEELFLLLTSVSHVGPKLALNVLSGLQVQELVSAIAKGDVVRLTKLHGVGKKTAERLVLELKEKVKSLSTQTSVSASGRAAPRVSSVEADVASALQNLGYKEGQAQQGVATAIDRLGAEAPFEAVFREALKALRAPQSSSGA